MREMIPYLIFPGTCREALTFYTDCFGGKVTALTTFADSPIPVDAENAEGIFDAEIRAEGIRFRASDSLPDQPARFGNNFALLANFSDLNELHQVYATLADGGDALMPLDDSRSSGAFGMVADRFGVQWMLHHEGQETE